MFEGSKSIPRRVEDSRMLSLPQWEQTWPTGALGAGLVAVAF